MQDHLCIPAAIISSGNIGTDLMIKLMRHGKVLSMGVMIGIDPASDFLRHTETAAQRHGLPVFEILVELGKRRMIGGQKDMIVDVALDMLKVSANHSKAEAQ